jgi:hypothetical protein
MESTYKELHEVLTRRLTPPLECDAITVEYRGVTLHVYGFLHGVTGGGSREYRRFVQTTIDHASGIIMSEKGYKTIYRGIEADLEDWAAVPLLDALQVPLRFISAPANLLAMIRVGVAESRCLYDLFEQGTQGDMSHLGSSRFFHLLDPNERRKLSGFPEPETYLRVNLQRNLDPFGPDPHQLHIPDPNWKWMTTLEPVSNIPLRSLHMLEFAAEYVLTKGQKIGSLFVGEIHNTDISWLVHVLSEEGILGDWTDREQKLLNSLRLNARTLARQAATGKDLFPLRLPYLTAWGLGLLTPLIATFGATLSTRKGIQILQASLNRKESADQMPTSK